MHVAIRNYSAGKILGIMFVNSWYESKHAHMHVQLVHEYVCRDIACYSEVVLIGK